MNRSARTALVVALAAVVVLAFRVSWNALKDVATAVGMDPTAATVYPIVVDGLMALALVATLVLQGRGKKLALWTLGGYTVASLVLNYVHGVMPELHSATAAVALPWGLVLLATSLPVGAIFFGSDLVARIIRAGGSAQVTPRVAVEETPGAETVAPPAAAPEPVAPAVAPESERVAPEPEPVAAGVAAVPESVAPEPSPVSLRAVPAALPVPVATVTATVPEPVGLLTVADVAERCGVAPATVRSWVSRGRLAPALRDGRGRALFDAAAVEALAA